MIRVLTKLGLSGGVISGTVSVTEPLFVNSETKPQKREISNTTISEITKFEDISIYAKQKGCSFIFVNSWENKKVYSPEEFITEEQTEDKETWKDRLIKTANENKSLCSSNNTLTFFFNPKNKILGLTGPTEKNNN